MMNQEAIERARRNLKALEGGGPLRHPQGQSPLAALGDSPVPQMQPPESVVFVEVPATQANPTGKVMLRQVLVAGFDVQQLQNLVRAVAEATANVVIARLAGVEVTAAMLDTVSKAPHTSPGDVARIEDGPASEEQAVRQDMQEHKQE